MGIFGLLGGTRGHTLEIGEYDLELVLCFPAQDFGIPQLMNHSLKFHVVIQLIRHHRKVLRPWQLSIHQIEHEINECLNIITGTQITPHYHVI